MNTINCFACSSSIPEVANFCGYCGKSVKCKACGKQIDGEYKFCLSCGSELAGSSNSTTTNSMKFKDNADGREFEATFSDNVGKNITETLGNIFMSKQIFTGQSLTSPEMNSTSEDKKIIDIKYTEVDQESNSLSTNTGAENEPKPSNDNTTDLNSDVLKLTRIFQEEESNITLNEIRLKATSKLDYSQRLTHLYIYYFHKIKKQKADKKGLNELLRSVDVEHGNFRRWFSKYANINVSKDGLSLIIPGQERAKQILQDVFDAEKSDQWIPGAQKRKTQAKKKGNSEDNIESIASPKKKLQTLSLVNSLNLHPAGSESLKEFHAKFSLSSYYEKNLVFTYYLEKILKVNAIGLDHIYTCYKSAGERVPGNLYQSLIDTRKNKGWIDTQNVQQLFVTTSGENYIEHDLKKLS